MREELGERERERAARGQQLMLAWRRIGQREETMRQSSAERARARRESASAQRAASSVRQRSEGSADAAAGGGSKAVRAAHQVEEVLAQVTSRHGPSPRRWRSCLSAPLVFSVCGASGELFLCKLFVFRTFSDFDLHYRLRFVYILK